MTLLSVKNLHTSFHTRDGIVRAVNGVSFDAGANEVVGIVGESGSGKSVLCYSLLGLIPQPPGRIESGSAVFDGVDLLKCPPPTLRGIRGNTIAMIFQDPMTSLNPYMRIEQQLIEPLLAHGKCDKPAARRRAVQVLEECGIQDAPRRIRLFPHEFSGGMRQRVMIAMALIPEPKLLIADEPTTALDVTVQAQILDLLNALQEKHATSIIFITHDLAVVAEICDRVLVMYAGQILESAQKRELFANAKHPYTRALQKSIPSITGRDERLATIAGLPPDLSREMPGCPFAPRCVYAADDCTHTRISLMEVAPDHRSACLRVQRNEVAL
ncbi:MAG: ATP-binding cassette domain-containing protein [Chitinivibrionales bacterium]|nr:ATP-binding cassette domain-containing protein [Chitinivibrionales bacterium]